MKFTQTVKFYSVNDDNTVTIYSTDEVGTKRYFRSNARYDILSKMAQLKKDDEVLVTIGIAYVRDKGLVMQIVEVA
jgi:hypothetical protein